MDKKDIVNHHDSSFEGYVFIAYGEKYLNQSLSLIKTIKLFDRKRKYILISNLKSKEFDENIDISHEFINEKDNHNKYCIIARIMAPKYINLEKFLMIDTDIVCLNNIDYIWKVFKKNNTCFNCIGGRDGSSWHWGHIDKINKKYTPEVSKSEKKYKIVDKKYQISKKMKKKLKIE